MVAGDQGFPTAAAIFCSTARVSLSPPPDVLPGRHLLDFLRVSDVIDLSTDLPHAEMSILFSGNVLLRFVFSFLVPVFRALCTLTEEGLGHPDHLHTHGTLVMLAYHQRLSFIPEGLD
jgi:hypothetical protein